MAAGLLSSLPSGTAQTNLLGIPTGAGTLSVYNPFGYMAEGSVAPQATQNVVAQEAPAATVGNRGTGRRGGGNAFTDASFITEGNRALNLPTTAASVYGALQNYNAPTGLGFVRTGTPSNKELKTFANNLTNAASGYQTTADQFGNLYADFVEGRMSEADYVNNLQKMQELSKVATGQYNDINKMFDSGMFAAPQMVAGVPMQRNTLGLTPAQRFVLPQETWNMSPQQLANWIQRYEKDMGSDWIGGDLAWAVAPSLITGAALSPLGLGTVGTGVLNTGASSLLSPKAN